MAQPSASWRSGGSLAPEQASALPKAPASLGQSAAGRPCQRVVDRALDQLPLDWVPKGCCAGRLLCCSGTGVGPDRGAGAAAGSGDQRRHRLLWALQRGSHGSRRSSGLARTSGCARSATGGGRPTRPWLGQWPGHGRSGRAWPCLADGEVQGSREEGAMLVEQPGVLHVATRRTLGAQQARGRKIPRQTFPSRHPSPADNCQNSKLIRA